MLCHELETYLADYASDEAEPERREALLAHIENCAACRAEFNAYEEQDKQLRRYFKSELDSAQLSDEPTAGTKTPAVANSAAHASRLPHWIGWAAAALVALSFGVATLKIYRGAVPQGEAQLAVVQTTAGRVLALGEGLYRPIVAGGVVRQDQPIKVLGGGYLALRLPDGNVIEARGGTQLRLRDLPGRFEVAMHRGQVWAHLHTPPAKRFDIATAHLVAKAVGTVYSVEEGLDRSVVTVAEGEVEVEADGAEASVGAAESYNSLSGETSAASPLVAAWSRYKEDLLALLPESATGDDGQAPLLQTTNATSAPDSSTNQTPLSSAAGAPSSFESLVDLFPEDTLYFLHLRDWRGALDEFKASDYGALLLQDSLRQWWTQIGAQQVWNEILTETDLVEVLSVVHLVGGEMAVSVNSEGRVLALAECGGEAEAVRERLRLLLTEDAETGAPTSELSAHVSVAGDYLVFSSDPTLLEATVGAIASGEATSFASSEFYRKVQADIDSPRLIMAANLGGQIAQASERLVGDSHEAEVNQMFDLLGLPSLDYFLLSPDFSGRGMQQAARLAFVDEGRFGAMDWLAEPAPMRSLDFFGAEIPFFAAAIVREPQEILLDLLAYYQGVGRSETFQQVLDLAASNDAFIQSLGGEIAIGLDRPILPIPNLKIVIEVADEDAFREGLNRLIEAFQKESEETGRTMTLVETIEHKGRVVSSLVIDVLAGSPIRIRPSWAFIDGYFIAGPGPEFVCDSIDVCASGHSIATDARRFLPLLPSGADLNFSLLVYQDVAQSLPSVVSDFLAPKLTGSEAQLLPDLSFMETYSAPGIAYAYARPTCIDFYLRTPTGIDMNFTMAVPLVANWLAPRTRLGQVVTRLAEAQTGLGALEAAAKAFRADKGRLPASLGELVEPGAAYIEALPQDPFAPVAGQYLNLIAGPAEGQITLYSVGPDAVDDRGTLEYSFAGQYDGPGDVVVRVGP